jgi:hypothetical protein
VPYGDDIVNWQYIEDMTNLVVQACNAQRTTTRVFSTTGAVLTMRESIALLASMLPQARLDFEPGTMGLAWRYDTAPLEKELGVRGFTAVRDGFARTIAVLQNWRSRNLW